MTNSKYVNQLDVNHIGMVFKFVKKGNQFVHTMIEGQLLYHLGFTPKQIVGKTLDDFFPEDYAVKKSDYYAKAWGGDFIHYESNVNGIHYIASLRPIYEDGRVVEVIGSCIHVPGTESPADVKRNFEVTSLKETQLSSATRKNLMIKDKYNYIFIPLTDIIFVERMDRKSVLHTNNKMYETNETLTNLSQQLNKNFIRSHRSFILNIEYLEIIEQRGNRYIGHFKNYENTAKISNVMVDSLKNYKSY